jgi:hypothetical protein
MRTSAVREVGGYDPELRAQSAEGCEDWKLAIQLAERHKFAVVPKILVGYRHSRGNMSDRTATMIKSARLVAAEVAMRHPELAGILHEHIGERLFSYSLKCVKQGRWSDAFSLLRQAVPYGSLWNLKRIAGILIQSAFRVLPWLKRQLPASNFWEGRRRKFLFDKADVSPSRRRCHR